MSDLVWLTLARYPPRVLSERVGGRGMRVAAWRLAAWALALTWFPAGFHQSLRPWPQARCVGLRMSIHG